ncbi:MAG: polyphenol oxidase family protein [Candidatus Omnitrophica bacterium]|nr:polyphenol oxidase family protein [Candidatus Omnitrophota bacterium]
MKLTEKENCFFIEDFFKNGVIAGFTKPVLQGDVLKDIPEIPCLKDFRIAFLKQIHSATIHHVQEGCFLEGDGLITDKPGIVCVVRTADCMPVFLCSEELNVVGVIHMGWRGAKLGILDNINYDLKTFKAVAGVAMRQCCYEVGKEFFNYQELKLSLKEKNNSLYFNPADFIKRRLESKGLKKENFFDLNICSICSEEKFYSFRRNATDFRTLSFIVRAK